MAHKTLVGGTAYEVKSGKTHIGGTGYDIKKGRTLIGGTGYDISFSTTVGDLAVGTSVYMNVDGVRKEWLVVHQGKPSSLYDDSCNGTWLLMKEIYTKKVWGSIDTYLNGPSSWSSTFLDLLETDIQNAIKQVKIPYHDGTELGKTYTGANGRSAKIFTLSGYECGWTTGDNSYFPVDGAKLDYFTASSAGNSKRIAYYNGSVTAWSLRSPYTFNSNWAWVVWTDGSCNGNSRSNAYGVRPALIFPQEDVQIDDNFNIIIA